MTEQSYAAASRDLDSVLAENAELRALNATLRRYLELGLDVLANPAKDSPAAHIELGAMGEPVALKLRIGRGLCSCGQTPAAAFNLHAEYCPAGEAQTLLVDLPKPGFRAYDKHWNQVPVPWSGAHPDVDPRTVIAGQRDWQIGGVPVDVAFRQTHKTSVDPTPRGETERPDPAQSPPTPAGSGQPTAAPFTFGDLIEGANCVRYVASHSEGATATRLRALAERLLEAGVEADPNP